MSQTAWVIVIFLWALFGVFVAVFCSAVYKYAKGAQKEPKAEARLADVMADAVARTLVASITQDPNKQLSEAGFNWACYMALKRHWPDVSFAEAVDGMMDYIGVNVGTEGYSWTWSAAQEIADEYAGQFGEVA